MRFPFCYLAMGLLFSSLPTLWAGRNIVSLDGDWEFVKVKSLDEPIPASGWQRISVPGTLNGINYERAWFRKTINIPKEWKGSRILLRFGGVKFNSRVLVNGRNVGGCFNGYDAFELDITEAVDFGKRNEILVACHDWTGVFVGEKVDFASVRGNIELREVPKDRIISPIGGHYYQYGIWNSVYLLSVPSLYIKEALIRPSIREKQIKVDLKIVNAGREREEITVR
ncbi:MAG: sugar-binding domain-containing protein, partial [bacterium]